MFRTPLIVVRDSLIATVLFGLIGVAYNAIRDDGIPLIADEEYAIYVPCPEPLGEVDPMDADDPDVTDDRTILVDARYEEDFDEWHVSGAIHVQYDYLDPIPEDVLNDLTAEFAGSGKARVVVYGDGTGSLGDTGYELGRELSGRGLKNVFVVQGGADALKEVHP